MSVTYTHPFGAALRDLRERRGAKQSDIATAVGVTRATIAQWEAGRHLPSPDRLRLLDNYLGAHGALRRLVDEEKASAGTRETVTPIELGPNLLAAFRDIETALEGYLSREAAGEPLGWCHNLQRRSPRTALATAYGLKTMLMINDYLRADLHPVASWLREQVIPEDGWVQRHQATEGPEAISVVLDAIVRIDPLVDVHHPLGLLETHLGDQDLTDRPYVAATALETMLNVQPTSTLTTDLLQTLLTSRRATSDKGVRLWSQTSEPDLVAPEPSVPHTARAVAVLARARIIIPEDSELATELGDAVDGAVGWLLERNDFSSSSEGVERVLGDETIRVYRRHFTAAWVVRALLLAGQDVGQPAVMTALAQLWSSYNKEHSLWRWSNGDLPVWMTYDAVTALKLAAVASFFPN